MKVQCDVCKGEAEAAVFCCADEAALCGPCDGRVHSANKLAGKHRRLSLVHTDSPQQFPLCDICKEKRALVFCQEDRAILCRDCDAPIHDANDLTRKHSRFLLTGIRLSPFSALAAPEVIASSSDTSVATSPFTTTAFVDGKHSPATVNRSNQHSCHSVVDCAAAKYEKPRAAFKETTDKKSKAIGSTASGFGNWNTVLKDVALCSRSNAATPTSAAVTTTGGSSISEYLMKELPGWHVEDLLLDPCPVTQPAATFDFQMPSDDLTPYRGEDMDTAAAGGAMRPECTGGKVPAWWIPRVPQFLGALAPSPLVLPCDHLQQLHQETAMGAGGQLTELLSRQQQHQCWPREQPQHQHDHRWATDEGFTVPEVTGVHRNPERSRTSSRRIHARRE